MRRYVIVILAAAISGTLLGASLPPTGCGFLAWFALVPLLYAVSSTRFVYGFCAGLFTSVVPAVLLSIGLFPVPYRAAGEPNWIYGGYALFGILLAVVTGVCAETKPPTLRRILALSALSVVFEASLAIILPVHLGLALDRMPGALDLASVTGIWGVSYLLWFANFALVAGLRGGTRTRLLVITPVLICMIAARYAPHLGTVPGTHKVAVIQTLSNDLQHLGSLNAQAHLKGAELVTWPELSAIVAAPVGDTNQLKKLSARSDQAPFVTSYEDAASPKPHNVAALFARGGQSDLYFKRKPFAGEATLHAAGDKAVFAQSPVGYVGLNICFDSCDPSVMRDTARLGKVQLIALPTQDPVSSNGVIQSIHAAYTPFRAAELGVPIARADITDDSMIVDSNGLILTELPPGEQIGVATPSLPRWTVYYYAGDWFLYLCYVAVVIFLIRPLLRVLPQRRNRKVTDKADLTL